MGRQALLTVAHQFQLTLEDFKPLDQQTHQLYRAGHLVIKLIDKTEADIYRKLGDSIELPVVYLDNDVMVMKDLGESLAGRHLTEEQTKRIIQKLIRIQRAPVEVPVYPLDEIERTWLRDLCDELNIDLMITIDRYYDEMQVKHYQLKLPLVLTHGDLHRGNIFDRSHIQLIDWERAALSSPVRDITMLLQDFATIEEINYYRDAFHQMMPYEMNQTDYTTEFSLFLLVNTVKMLVWELSKYQQGMQNQDETKREVNRKMDILKLLET
ncbi:phosphotransferase family protein [Macrococcus brunensis]|uniref:phosphotransferase family protein n=1 Tax=Macrococcus brunensis TaxID=198483 RepID=UPI001EEF928A|nr:aminoglycoside phosphotransferase family protein [Macrococcus brunensis]ULG71634.1 aminoglycoside phosphotransferase family protein [Macrococcus brunensis]